MKRLLGLFFFASTVFFGFQSVVVANSQDQHATVLYQEGQFDRAKQEYERLLEQDKRSGDILYNLGNIYFKKGEFGEALTYYLRAQRFDPRNGDLHFNMAQIQMRVQDKFSESPFSIFFWRKFIAYVSLPEAVVLFSLPFSFFLGVLFRCLWRRLLLKDHLNLLLVSGFMSLITGFIALMACYSVLWTEFGVIIESKIPLKSGPSESLATQGYVHEGTLLIVKQKSSDSGGQWINIALPNGVQGWIRNEQIWLVSQ